MNIGVLGTGVVGRTIAAALAAKGQSVMMGTRDVQASLARNEPGAYGAPPLGEWHAANPAVALGSFAQAAAHGALNIHALTGQGALPGLEAAGEAALAGKILIDISNPLDFSHGMPPSLFVVNTDSLGEQIQRRFPAARVVKTLNTVTAALMVNPALVGGGDHAIYVSGDDAAAKVEVTGYLRDWFGWQQVVDLGGIASARSAEMILPLWVNLMMVQGTPLFNFRIVR